MTKLLLSPLIWLILLPVSSVKAADYDLSPIQEMALSVQDLRPLIDEAQRNTDRSERFRFEYKDLISDLAIIHNGLVFATTGQADKANQGRPLFIQYGYVGRTAEARYLSLLKHELLRLKNRSLSLVKTAPGSGSSRQINYQLIAADFSSVIDAITVALAGSGDRPRRFPAIGGGNL